MDDEVIRIFLSSPGDVAPEREAAARVVSSLNAARPEGPRLEIIRWEESYYTADSGFQDQIAPTSECDLVICIFWKSLGSDLPESYRRADGALPTGTEFEFETALERSLRDPDQLPDVLVYRKEAEITYRAETVELEQAQLARFQAFWARWFRNEQGHFVAGFHAFEDTAAFEAQLRAHLTQWLDRRQGAVAWTGGSPFRGLRPFDLEHAPVFFGRTREVSRLRARFLANALRGVRFLAVVGPSGSGKSSLIRAGLLPNLLQTVSTPDLPAFAHHAIIRPSDIGGDWPKGLADALFAPEALGAALSTGDSATPDRLATLFRDAPAAAAPALDAALARASGEATRHALVLLVDQLEEVFVWPEAAQIAFAEMIEKLCSDAEVYVIASMRAEFGDRLASFAPLARLAETAAVSGATPPVIALTSPSAADLRELINGPARVSGLSFEPGLAARIEAEATSEALPALQFLLQKLYEDRDGMMLTHAGFDALGGVGQVMASQGDAALAALEGDVAEGFAVLVRRLVILREAGGSPVSRPVLTTSLGPQERNVAQALVDSGLLVRDADTTRLAHEALITDWGRFADAVARDRRLLETRYRLGLMARAHGEMSDPIEARSALLTGFALSEARQLQEAWSPAEIGAEESLLPGFIEESFRADRAARRRRFAVTGAASAAVIAAGLALFWQQQKASEFALLAELQSSTAKAANASLRSGDWPVAVAEARRARSLVQDADTLSLALSVVLGADSRDLVEIRDGAHVDVGFTRDGQLYALTSDGQLQVGDREMQFPSVDRQAYHKALPLADGGAVAVTQAGLIYHQAADGQLSSFDTGLEQHFAEFMSLIEFEDGITLVSAPANILGQGAEMPFIQLHHCKAGAAALDCRLQEVRKPTRDTTHLVDLALSPDGAQLAMIVNRAGTSRPGLSLYLVTLSGQALPQRLTSFQGLSRVRFSEGGRQLLLAAERSRTTGQRGTGVYQLDWQDENPEMRVLTERLSSWVFEAARETDRFVYRCGALALCLADADNSGLRLIRLPGLGRGLAISDDGTQVAAIVVGGALRHWRSSLEQAEVWTVSSQFPVRGLAAEDGTLVAMDAGFNLHRWGEDGRFQRLTGQNALGIGAMGTPHMALLEGGRVALSDGSLTVATVDPQRLDWEWSDETYPFRVVRLAPAPGGGVLAAGLQGVSTPDGFIPAPEGLRVGGVTGHGDAIYFSTTDGGVWQHLRGTIQRAVPKEASADEQAGLSLDVHPTGRFIAVTRSDRKVLVHDLEGEHPPIQLDIPTDDSRVVAFSPDGGHFAVLTSAGQMGVWRFDAEGAQAEPHLFVDPIPPALVPASSGPAARMANWIDWVDGERLAVASETGDVIIISIKPGEIETRLERLDRLYTTGRAD